MQRRIALKTIYLFCLGLLSLSLAWQCSDGEPSWQIDTSIQPIELDITDKQKTIFSDTLILAWKDGSALSKDILYRAIKTDNNEVVHSLSNDTFCVLRDFLPNATWHLSIQSQRRSNPKIQSETQLVIQAKHDSILPLTPTDMGLVYTSPLFSWHLGHIFFSRKPFHYELYIDTSASFSHPQVFSTTHDTINPHISIQRDRTYFWKVGIAYADYPETFYSKTMRFIGASYPPTAPVLVSPANQSQNIGSPITFMWHPSTDPENAPVSYSLEVRNATQQVVFSNNNITDTFLQANITLASEADYTWSVKSSDGGSSSASATFSFRSVFIPFLDVDKDTLEFTQVISAPQKVVNISSNSDWAISDIPSWISLSATQGNSNATLNVSVQDNPTFFPRSANIIFLNDTYHITDTLTITQVSNVPFLNLDRDTIFVSSAGGTDMFTISTNTDWTINTPPSWLTLSTHAGTRNQQVIVTTPSFTGGKNVRQATLSIRSTNANLSKTITIIQESECFKSRRNDSLVLMKLYQTMNGSQWLNHSGWLTTSLDGWYGITLTDDGCTINEINLQRNALQGKIPSELGSLNTLERLYLNGNKISDTLPTAFFLLANLKELDLSGNELSGKLPKELGNFRKLETLILSSNQFFGNLPTELGNLVNLKNLQIAINKIGGNISTSLKNLQVLEILNLSNNLLQNPIPKEIMEISTLSFIDISNNNITGSIPEEIENLRNLQVLYLQNNSIDGTIPANIGNLSNLIDFAVYNNQIGGTIPKTIGNLTKLFSIDLHSNQLSGSIPSDLGDLSNLYTLDLSFNQLLDSIPSELGALNNLTTLILNNNNLSYYVPNSICIRKNNGQYIDYSVVNNTWLVDCLFTGDRDSPPYDSIADFLEAVYDDAGNLEELVPVYRKIPKKLSDEMNKAIQAEEARIQNLDYLKEISQKIYIYSNPHYGEFTISWDKSIQDPIKNISITNTLPPYNTIIQYSIPATNSGYLNIDIKQLPTQMYILKNELVSGNIIKMRLIKK